MSEFIAIGHTTIDLDPDYPTDISKARLGGGVSYSASAAGSLGFNKVAIITEEEPLLPYIRQLEDRHIEVHRLSTVVPEKERTTTTFKNVYINKRGGREQFLLEQQDEINIQDWPEIESRLTEGATVLIAPVIGEVNIELYPKIREEIGKNGILAVTPQGYLRGIEDGEIIRQRWDKVDAWDEADIVVLSAEDLTFDRETKDEKMDKAYLERIISLDSSPIVVLTRGGEGLTVYENGRKPFEIQPFRLEKGELRDLTGAGDSCAAAFIWHYIRFKDMKEAGVFAALYPALKIMGIGGGEGGIGSLPTLQEVQNFIDQNREGRIREFFDSNGVKELRLSPEGNHLPPEIR